MKQLIPLVLALLSFQAALANSRYVTLTSSNSSETVLPTDVIEVVYSTLNGRAIFRQSEEESFTLRFNETDQIDRNISPIGKHILTGVSQIDLPSGGVITFKITPAATTVTTSKPVMIPPTSASDDTVNVQLQVSTDLKNWEDVAPGEFLGSDTLRFFRVKVTSGNPE